MRIKNIIFDLGGVLLNIDYLATIKSFENLGITDFEKLFSQANQIHLFDKLDTGLISPDEFRNEIRNISGLNISNQDIDNAWNAMLLDMPKHRILLLENAKKHYRTFLLSNTNAIHYPEYSKYLLAEHGYASLSMLFEKQYLSHEIKLRKPNIEAFQYILSENNLKPSETLFIDDTAQHVTGAKKAGLNAYWLDLSKESIDDIFENGVFKESLLMP